MFEGDNEKKIQYLAILSVFKSHIANYCYSHSDSVSDAQDLSQEILMLVWENLDHLRADDRTPQQVNRWLRKLMRTAFIRHLRQKPRIKTVSLSHAAGVPEETSDEGELVEDLLSELSESDRKLMEERLEGYTNAEIAKYRHQTENSVGQHFFRIITKLRKQ